jgi:hypothetical protein
MIIEYDIPGGGIVTDWLYRDTAIDGGVDCASATYTSATRGTGTLSAGTIGDKVVGQKQSVGNGYECFQIRLEIDLSSIPTDAIVHDIQFEFFPRDIFAITDWTFRIGTDVYGPALSTADYIPAVTGTTNLTDDITDIDALIGELLVSTATEDAWNALDMSGPTLSYTSRVQDVVSGGAGLMGFVLYSKEHENEDAPASSTSELLGFSSGDDWVRLKVTYALPGGSGGSMLGMTF